MPTIHILQKDLNAGVVDSYTIDMCSIAELHCRYPIQSEKELDDDVEVLLEEMSESEPDYAEANTDIDASEPELDIMYTNGEHKVLTVAVPTSFLLYLEGGKMVCKTANMQEFEKAFQDASVLIHEAEESSE